MFGGGRNWESSLQFMCCEQALTLTLNLGCAQRNARSVMLETRSQRYDHAIVSPGSGEVKRCSTLSAYDEEMFLS